MKTVSLVNFIFPLFFLFVITFTSCNYSDGFKNSTEKSTNLSNNKYVFVKDLITWSQWWEFDSKLKKIKKLTEQKDKINLKQGLSKLDSIGFLVEELQVLFNKKIIIPPPPIPCPLTTTDCGLEILSKGIFIPSDSPYNIELKTTQNSELKTTQNDATMQELMTKKPIKGGELMSFYLNKIDLSQPLSLKINDSETKENFNLQIIK